jgi:sec-independent protein translocase protein TatC
MTDAPLLSHLIELRNRLIWCVAVLAVAFVICYIFAAPIYSFLVEPLAHALQAKGGDHKMIYTQLTEAFFTYLGVALWAAVFVTSPFVLMQIWKFMAPGLYANERKMLLPYLAATPILFLLGAAMAYYIVFPAAWGFFLGFETPAGPAGLAIQLEPRVGEYLSLAMSLILAFGLSFELPLALVLAVHAGVVEVATLKKYRRIAIVGSFVVAAVVTPPDVLSQLALAIPLCLFYEAAILAGGFIEKGRLDADKEEETQAS